MGIITRSPSGLKPAVFLDRDGTIIEDRGYLRDPSEVCFYPETVPALRLLSRHFLLFIVTNQMGISAGLLNAAEADRVNGFITGFLAAGGIKIQQVYCCPHVKEDGCKCRKPSSYYLEKAAGDYGVDLPGSFTVGDHPCDVEMGVKTGATGILLLTGHGEKHRGEVPDCTAIAADMHEAANLIFSLAGLKNGAER